MSLTIGSTVVHNDITLTAGAGNTTSSDQDLTAAYKKWARVRLTNGATGPTAAAQCAIKISEDTTAGNYMEYARVVGSTGNSAVVEQCIELPDTAMHVIFVSGSNTNQNVTLRAVIEKITAL